MDSSPPRTAVLHELRVLVSTIQLVVDEATRSNATNDAREMLRDQVTLLAEVLRVLTEVEDGLDHGITSLDVRAVAWVAKSRHPDVFLGKMLKPARVRTSIRTLVELLDTIVSWVCETEQRARILLTPPASLIISPAPALAHRLEEVPSDRELEQAIQSLAGAARVEVSLQSSPRSARIDLISEGDSDENGLV